MNAALVLGLVVGAHASAVELTKSNFDELVLNSGKGALVKFLAPWFAFIVVWHMEHSAALIV